MYSNPLFSTTLFGLLVVGSVTLVVPGPARATAVIGSSQRQQAETLYNQGVLQHEKGNLEAAIALYTDALELNPESAVTYSARAGAFGKLEEYDAAIEDYSAAIELDDDLAPAYGGRGLALSLNGDLDAGVDDLWTAAQLFREQNQMEQYFKTLAIIEGVAP